MLKVEGLGKRFGSRWIFRNLAFEIGLGDTLVISGRNGSGKSTLLRTLAGLSMPTEGKITLPEGDSRTLLGFSALEQSLYPLLTVAEHLRLAADLRGCADRTEDLLRQVDLLYAKDFPAAQLSTGMKTRLKLALATQAEPQVLLLDEPSAGLDWHGRALVVEVIDDQRERGCLVMASNDPTERRLAELELKLED